jgi:hypothetical protein
LVSGSGAEALATSIVRRSQSETAVDEDVGVHDRSMPDRRDNDGRSVDLDDGLTPRPLRRRLLHVADRPAVDLDRDRPEGHRRDEVDGVADATELDRPVQPLPLDIDLVRG